MMTNAWRRPGSGGVSGPGAASAGSRQNYRGGGAGVEADLGLRQSVVNAGLDSWKQRQGGRLDSAFGEWQARFGGYADTLGQKNSARAGAMGYATNDQVGAAKGRLTPSLEDWNRQKTDGNMSAAEEAEQLMYQQEINNRTGAAASQAFNSSASSRGLGANPGAIAALGSQTMWQTAAAQGDLKAKLMAQEADARERGRQGYEGTSRSLAELEMTPTQENAQRMIDQMEQMSDPGAFDYDKAVPGGFDDGLMAFYDQFRDAKVGPSDWDWNNVQAPESQGFPTWPGYPGGSGPSRGGGGYGGGGWGGGAPSMITWGQR